MGIPSYFSYIVKNHRTIIKRLDKNTVKINNLYMDCNSIIYDAVYKINFSKLDDTDVSVICSNVFSKIDEYIALLQPDTNVFIAFDGVAPVAKLEQQRQRRYKSAYQAEITKTIFKNTKPDAWNTAAITPGSEFMVNLNSKIRQRYTDPAKYGVKNLILSPSDRSGEGEHKLFEYIRNFPEQHNNNTTVIYGLDADLIMLSINHLPISKQIYLFRETPEFIKSIDSELEPNQTYLLDIPELSSTIMTNMSNGVGTVNRVYDYIFICFFLGNDFMPHFPSINIRTGGIDKMLNAYKATIGPSEFLTDGTKIYWKNVRKLVQFLANLEEANLKTEASLRDKRENSRMPETTPEDRLKKFEALPTYDRVIEKYINPHSSNWQARYYKTLFDVEIDEMRKKQICTNYLEGLEWTMRYYTSGCPDWRWCYNYNYPPLLEDLIHHIPYFDTTFIGANDRKPVTEMTQLCYVLPKQSLHMIPKKIHDKVRESGWYKSDCEFVWAYCRYFWECHVQLPEIDIDELEKMVNG
jgi:5'-3' exoribonuclease 1